MMPYPTRRSPGKRQLVLMGETKTSVLSGKTHSTDTSLRTGAMAFFRDLIIWSRKQRGAVNHNRVLHVPWCTHCVLQGRGELPQANPPADSYLPLTLGGSLLWHPSPWHGYTEGSRADTDKAQS